MQKPFWQSKKLSGIGAIVLCYALFVSFGDSADVEALKAVVSSISVCVGAIAGTDAANGVAKHIKGGNTDG